MLSGKRRLNFTFFFPPHPQVQTACLLSYHTIPYYFVPMRLLPFPFIFLTRLFHTCSIRLPLAPVHLIVIGIMLKLPTLKANGCKNESKAHKTVWVTVLFMTEVIGSLSVKCLEINSACLAECPLAKHGLAKKEKKNANRPWRSHS